MSDIKHTPGPWINKLPSMNDEHMCRVMSAGYPQEPGYQKAYPVVAMTWSPEHVVSYVGLSRQECIANARLIAAAPDGLALAKAVVEYFGDDPIDPLLDGDIRLREMARAIVAKAEGGAQ